MYLYAKFVLFWQFTYYNVTLWRPSWILVAIYKFNLFEKKISSVLICSNSEKYFYVWILFFGLVLWCWHFYASMQRDLQWFSLANKWKIISGSIQIHNYHIFKHYHLTNVHIQTYIILYTWFYRLLQAQGLVISPFLVYEVI